MQKIAKHDLALFAEISLKTSRSAEKSDPFYILYIKNLVRREISMNAKYMSTLFIPLLIFFANLSSIKENLIQPLQALSLHHLKKDVMSLNVLEGSFDGNFDKIVLMKNEVKNIHLVSPNLIRIVYETYDDSIKPSLLLKPKNEKNSPQSIQMELESNEGIVFKFGVNFSLSEEMEVFSPSFSPKPILSAVVDKSSTPEISLSLKEKKEEWDDSEPILLRLKSYAKNNLSKIILKLKMGQDQFQEMVSSFEGQSVKEHDSEFSLSPGKYLTSDSGELEVFAEVHDAKLPTSLVGRSNVLRLTIISSYGRYKKSLGLLHKVKLEIDSWEENGDKNQKEKVKKLLESALIESEKTAFFDSFDRFKLRQFQEIFTKESSKEDLLPPLSQFLEEHESLDDRERDRDFFVALRLLSKMVSDQKHEKIQKMSENIKEFLAQRKERWAMRVNHLPDSFRPLLWKDIEKNDPFVKGIKKVQDLSQQKNSSTKAEDLLVSLSEQYKKWIETLEAAEDKSLEEKKKERNQHLASARNELQKLQQQQAEISDPLDKASTKDKNVLKDSWPSLMLKQNGNIKDTSALEGSMRTFLPQLSKRIAGAMEAMTLTRDAGEANDFEKAETYSDIASRLLRLAEKKSYEEQEDKRRERRKKLSGNQYYGQSIVNGDVQIEHDYKVDKRYRQDILDEVKGTETNEQDEVLLKNYLRNVVR